MGTSQQVAGASDALGLLLAIVALFTSAQASTLQSERARNGGPNKGAKPRIASLSITLAAVSVASLVSLFPVARAVFDAFGTHGWEPPFGIFFLVYLLLLPLCTWQLTIAVGALHLPAAGT